MIRRFLHTAFLLLVGCLLAPPADARQQVRLAVTGVVVDAETGLPISAANIALNGSASGASDQNGRFRIEVTLTPGATHRLTATRIGYERSERPFVIQDGTQTVDIIFDLVPVPVELGEIRIEGEAERASVANLTGFNRRRENLPGYFFTRDDIERIGAQRLTEVVRRVPGSIVYGPENVFVDPLTNVPEAISAFEQPTMITFQRSGYSRGAPCQALVFVNDVQVSDPNIDWLVDPHSVVAMEVYNGTSQVPAEYNKRGADCGVVVVWTDAPTRRPVRGLVNALEVGGVMTARMRGGIEGERFGVQIRVPLVGPIEFHPSFHVIVGNSLDGDAGWQLMTALKAKPFGRRTPFYVGTGMTVVKNRTSFFDSGRAGQEATNLMAVGLTGVSLPVGPVRPFLELQVLNPFGDRQGFIATGMTILQR